MTDIFIVIHKVRQWIYSYGLTFVLGLVFGLVIAIALWMRISQKSETVKIEENAPEIVHTQSERTLERTTSTNPPKLSRHSKGKIESVQTVELETPAGERVTVEAVTTQAKDGPRVTVAADGAAVVGGLQEIRPRTVQTTRKTQWSVSVAGLIDRGGVFPGLLVHRSSGPWVLGGGAFVNPATGMPEKVFISAGFRW